MVRVARLVLLIAVSSLQHVLSQSVNSTESCAVLYEKGVEAYLENNFNDCVLFFETAVERYRKYSERLLNCRLRCADEAEVAGHMHPTDVENLHFYEKAIRGTLCIIKCKNERDIFGYYNLNKETEQLFEDRKPYEYLHICYYQTNRVQKAASAVFTYIAEHPKDEIMLNNLKFYASMDDVDMNEIVNFEAKEYVYLYVHGTVAYDKKDWEGSISYMEESLQAFLNAEDGCRALCEGPFDQGWYPDLLPSIANHFTYCARCKATCRKRLSNLNGERHDDLLPSHYHYLQYAYFKTGNLKAACECVTSYLLFYPADETMLYNKEYYSKLPKSSPKYFKARSEATHYVQRQIYEDQLLAFVDLNFRADRLVPRDPFEGQSTDSERSA